VADESPGTYPWRVGWGADAGAHCGVPCRSWWGGGCRRQAAGPGEPAGRRRHVGL